MAGFKPIAWACAIAASFAVITGVSKANNAYPEKPVRIILPYGAGGIADVTTRLVAQKLSERLGQTFVVDNRPGASGVVAAKAVIGSAPDGYTLFLMGNGGAINESLYKVPPYSIQKDFTSVALLARFEMLLVTKVDSHLNSIAKMVAYAKEHPGKLNLGAINVGSTQNLSAELFRMATGVEAELVTYRTTPDLVTAILRGDVDLGFDFLAPLLPMITSKQIKAIATSGEHPNQNLPGVPLVKDGGYPEYTVISWNGISAPAGTPADIADKLNKEITAVLQMDDVKARMFQLGMEPMPATIAQMDDRIRGDIAKWRVVIDGAKIAKQ